MVIENKEGMVKNTPIKQPIEILPLVQKHNNDSVLK
jgi:hypothetical protein